jgi:hypothetical protein
MDKLRDFQLPCTGKIPVVVMSKKTNKPQEKLISENTFVLAGLKHDCVLRGIVQFLVQMLRKA